MSVNRELYDRAPFSYLGMLAATVEGLPALWERVEADVVIVRSLSADVPTAVFPASADAQIPAVLGVDHRGTRGLIILEDVSRTRLAAAIHAAAALGGHGGTI